MGLLFIVGIIMGFAVHPGWFALAIGVGLILAIAEWNA